VGAQDEASTVDVQEYAFARLSILGRVHAHRDRAAGIPRRKLGVLGLGEVDGHRQWCLACLAHLAVFLYADLMPSGAVGGDLF
jgi:hypothetical protein